MLCLIAFSQTEIKKTKNDVEVVTLEEVELTSYLSKREIQLIVCEKPSIVENLSGFSCKIRGKEIDNQHKENEFNIKLYPNPSVDGRFILNLNQKYNTVQLEVSLITGQRIFSKTFQNVTHKINVDLSKYSTGIYIINIIGDGKRLRTKKAIRG